MGPSRRSSPISCRASAENLRSQRSHALFQFQLKCNHLISSLHFHILLCSSSERCEKFAHIALFFTHLGPVFFFFFFLCRSWFSFYKFDYISLSTTSHKEIANKYFVGLFFRSASYSPIFTHLGRQNCRSVHLLCNKFLWDPVIDIKQSFISHRNVLYTLQTSSLTLFSCAEQGRKYG